MTTPNPQPFIPELPPNPDKIQKLFALRELLQKVANLKDKNGVQLFNYGDSHFRSRLFYDHPAFNILYAEAPLAVNHCGPPGCVAGWAGVLDPDHSVCASQGWCTNYKNARRFLELTLDEGNFLFMGGPYYDEDSEDEDREDYPDAIEKYGSLSQVPIEEAIRRIDFLIKKNE